jgi:hypothetical protein
MAYKPCKGRATVAGPHCPYYFNASVRSTPRPTQQKHQDHFTEPASSSFP